MRVIVIDDEKAMHLIMTRMLSKLADIEVAGCFFDTASASRYIAEHAVHAVFVDISMPLESGMQFAERMAMEHPDLYIIFVTSHKDYALDAFELSALDYFVKPVSLERIERSVLRARAIHQFAEAAQRELAPNRVRIQVLGGLEISTAHGSVKWISRKSAELFSYLLLHRDKVVPRARILYDLFGDMEAKNAEVYLNTSVYQLRKALTPHGLRAMVQSDGEGYGLDLAEASVDYVEFEERIHRHGEIAAADLEAALETDRQYVGDLFGEKGFDWALNDTERLSALYAAFIKKLAVALLTNREEETAIRLLNKLFSRNELDEETAILLLRAYAAKKDRASMIKLYRRYRAVLREELNIDPSVELEDLYARLQAI